MPLKNKLIVGSAGFVLVGIITILCWKLVVVGFLAVVMVVSFAKVKENSDNSDNSDNSENSKEEADKAQAELMKFLAVENRIPDRADAFGILARSGLTNEVGRGQLCEYVDADGNGHKSRRVAPFALEMFARTKFGTSIKARADIRKLDALEAELKE